MRIRQIGLLRHGLTDSAGRFCGSSNPGLSPAGWAEMDLGDWEDADPSAIWETEPGVLERLWQNPLRHPPPNGEPFEPSCDRVLSGWMDVVRTKESRILVVSHGGPIRLLLSHIERQPLERLLDVDVDYGSLHLVAACGAMVVRKLAKPTRTSAQ